MALLVLLVQKEYYVSSTQAVLFASIKKVRLHGNACIDQEICFAQTIHCQSSLIRSVCEPLLP